VLHKHIGALTAVFMYACGPADVSLAWQGHHACALKAANFRNATQDAKIISAHMTPEIVDACFQASLAGGGPLEVHATGPAAAAGDGNSSLPSPPHLLRISLAQFVAGLIYLATTRTTMRGDTGVQHQGWVALAVEQLINHLLNVLGARVTRSMQLMTFTPTGGECAAVQAARRPQMHAMLTRIARVRPACEVPSCSLACLAAFLHREELIVTTPAADVSASPPPVVPNSKLTQAALGAKNRCSNITTFPAIALPLMLDIDSLESIMLALAALRLPEGGGDHSAASLAASLSQLMDTCCSRLGVA